MTENWREREAARNLERVAPVWINEPFWTGNSAIHAGHFVHVSVSDSRLLAYVSDEAKGSRGIYTPVKPGRYLTRYFSGVLSAKEIAFYAAWQSRGVRPVSSVSELPLSFASTADDIASVYARGPTSCMDGRNFRDLSSMPVRIYAAGDLAVAYLSGDAPKGRPDHDVLARCLVWPDKLVAGRVYPTPGCWSADGFESDSESTACYDALQDKLLAAGYKFVSAGGSFEGARLERIESDERDGAVVMPYLDHSYNADDRGSYLVMSRSGDISGSETCGFVRYEPEEDEEPDYYAHCERCEDGIGSEWDTREVAVSRRRGYWNRETWCEDCADRHTFTCEGYDELCADDVDSVEVDGSTYSSAYAESNFTCSDYSGNWFDPDSDPSVEMDDGETWSESEFDRHGFRCAITGRCLPVKEAHSDYHEIAADCDDDEIAAWLARVDLARIEDARQEEMAV